MAVTDDGQGMADDIRESGLGNIARTGVEARWHVRRDVGRPSGHHRGVAGAGGRRRLATDRQRCEPLQRAVTRRRPQPVARASSPAASGPRTSSTRKYAGRSSTSKPAGSREPPRSRSGGHRQTPHLAHPGVVDGDGWRTHPRPAGSREPLAQPESPRRPRPHPAARHPRGRPVGSVRRRASVHRARGGPGRPAQPVGALPTRRARPRDHPVESPRRPRGATFRCCRTSTRRRRGRGAVCSSGTSGG